MRYGNVELHNAWDIVETEGRPGVRPSRLPLSILPEVNGGVQDGTYVGVCEIRGMLPPGGKASVVLQVESDNLNPPLAQTFHGCMHASTTLLSKQPTEVLIEAHVDAEKQKSDKVIYIDGRTILTDPAGLRLDLVHPGDDGMQEMGRNLAARIRATQAV